MSYTPTSYPLPTTEYNRWYSDTFVSGLKDKKRESNSRFERLTKKIEKILEHPEHYASSISRYHMKGDFHVFVGGFAIIHCSIEENLVEFHYIDQRNY